MLKIMVKERNDYYDVKSKGKNISPEEILSVMSALYYMLHKDFNINRREANELINNINKIESE